MSVLEMTFECDSERCDSASTLSSDDDVAIKEDLEVELLEQGWWIIRNWAYEKTYCSVGCLLQDTY